MESIPHEFEALSVLLVLLPGFLCARIAQSLSVRPKQSEIDKVVESLIYSFVVYLCFVCAFGKVAPLKLNVEDTKDKKSYSIDIQRGPLLGLAAISMALGLLAGLDSTKDLSGRLFRRTRFSQRTTRSSLWNDVFHDKRGYVQVGLADGRRVIGWVQYYADDPKEASLFLQNAAWLDKDNQEVEIAGGGVMLTKDSKIVFIEFLDPIISASPVGPVDSHRRWNMTAFWLGFMDMFASRRTRYTQVPMHAPEDEVVEDTPQAPASSDFSRRQKRWK